MFALSAVRVPVILASLALTSSNSPFTPFIVPPTVLPSSVRCSAIISPPTDFIFPPLNPSLSF